MVYVPSCHRNFHLAHLRQPVRSGIENCSAPNDVYLAILQAYHYRVHDDRGFLDAGSYVESEAGRVARQLKRRDPFRTQVLSNDLFSTCEIREDEPPGCAIEKPKVHVRKTVFEVGLTLPGIGNKLCVCLAQFLFCRAVGRQDPRELSTGQPGLREPTEPGGKGLLLPP